MADENKVTKTVTMNVTIVTVDGSKFTGKLFTSVQMDGKPSDDDLQKAKGFAVANFTKDLFTDKVQTVLILGENEKVTTFNKQHIIACEVITSEI